MVKPYSDDLRERVAGSEIEGRSDGPLVWRQSATRAICALIRRA